MLIASDLKKKKKKEKFYPLLDSPFSCLKPPPEESNSNSL